MSKSEVYQVFWDNIPGGSRAQDPEAKKGDLFFIPRGFVTDWNMFHFIINHPDGFEDYQANRHTFRLCSQRLKDLLEENKGPEDRLQWLDTTVTWNGETRPYYALHFYEDFDVVDPVLSKWNPETGFYDARKILVREKIVGHNVFTIPRDDIGLFLRSFIVKEMKRQKMTGMAFGGVEVR